MTTLDTIPTMPATNDASAGPAGDAPATDQPARAASAAPDLSALGEAISACTACPRLVRWREDQARIKVARFRDETYWARAVPGFGDERARILLVGLAPAAHGANRTGRMFTGDASGDFLWKVLHAVGLASQPTGRRAGDGLELHATRVVAAVRCAPPANKPTPAEQAACRPYLQRELQMLPDLRVIVPLGGIGWDGTLRALRAIGHAIPSPRPAFAHGAEAEVGPYTLLGTFHPSQQNTFTGRLTAPMLEAVLARAAALAGVRGPNADTDDGVRAPNADTNAGTGAGTNAGAPPRTR